MSDKVRERFEADANLRWHPDAKGPGLLDRDPADGYYNTAVEYAWRAWQASRAAALEEAKAVVRSSCLGDIHGCNRTCCHGCHTIAAERIGALAWRGA